MSQTLTVIADEVRSCTKCRLHQGTRNGVPGEGNPNAEILFIGEGPGANEDAQGRPFVGAAGKLLTEMLARAGLTRDDVFIANIVKHRPPGNRDPMPDEIDACWGYMERQIVEINPKLIVTLGRHSMMQFYGPSARITAVHGTVRPWGDYLAYACFHPAAALRQPKYREMLEQDFDGLQKALESARTRRAERAKAPRRPVDVASGTAASQPSLMHSDSDGPSQMTLL